MTDEQFAHWRDFSRRLAALHREGERLLVGVDQFFVAFPSADIPRVVGWDDDEGAFDDAGWGMSDRCDEMYDQWIPNYATLPMEQFDAAEAQWAAPIEHCLHAGFDAAMFPRDIAASGWAHGDLCLMFPEGVPIWIKDGWPTPFIDHHWDVDTLLREVQAVRADDGPRKRVH